MGTPLAALLITAGSLLVLVPVMRIGFLTLVRGISRPMTILFLAGNAALLLPARTPPAAAVLALVMAGMLLLWCGERLRQSTEVKTREGMIALALQFLPIGVVLGRNVWLYAADSLLYTAAALAAFVALRQLSLFMVKSSDWYRGINLLSGLLAGLTGMELNSSLLSSGTGSSPALVVATLVASAMIFEIAARGSEESRGYRSLAALVLVSGLGSNLLSYGGILATVLTMVVGSALIAGSYATRNRSLFIGGAVLLVGGTLQQLVHAIRFFDLAGWATITLVGVAAILLGSLLESSGGRLKGRFATWKARHQDWTY